MNKTRIFTEYLRDIHYELNKNDYDNLKNLILFSNSELKKNLFEYCCENYKKTYVFILEILVTFMDKNFITSICIDNYKNFFKYGYENIMWEFSIENKNKNQLCNFLKKYSFNSRLYILDSIISNKIISKNFKIITKIQKIYFGDVKIIKCKNNIYFIQFLNVGLGQYLHCGYELKNLFDLLGKYVFSNKTIIFMFKNSDRIKYAFEYYELKITKSSCCINSIIKHNNVLNVLMFLETIKNINNNIATVFNNLIREILNFI